MRAAPARAVCTAVRGAPTEKTKGEWSAAAQDVLGNKELKETSGDCE